MPKVLHLLKEGTSSQVVAPFNQTSSFAAVNSGGGNELYWVKSDGTLSADLLKALTAVTDSTTIDFTVSGNSLTGAIKLDAAADNLISATANGLYAKKYTGGTGITISAENVISAANLLITEVVVDNTYTTLSAWLTANSGGSAYQQGDFLILSAANPVQTWIKNSGTGGTSADWTQVNTIGINSFSVAGDTGSFSVTNGSTVTIAGGTGVTTSASGTTTTVHLNINELNALSPATPNAADTFAVYDESSLAHAKVTYANILSGVSFVATNGTTTTTIANGDTLGILAGGGLASTVSGDNITIGFSAAPTTGGSTKQVFQFDDGNGDTYSWVDVSTLDTNFFKSNLTQTANRAHNQGTYSVTIDGTGSWTLGSSTAGSSRLNVAGGDVELITADKGIIFKVGTDRWRLKILAGGILTTEAVQ